MTAELGRLARVVDEELTVEVHLVKVGGEDIATICGDLDIALADDGLALDLVHVVVQPIGTQLLRGLDDALRPVGRGGEVSRTVVVADGGLGAQAGRGRGEFDGGREALLVEGDGAYAAQLARGEHRGDLHNLALGDVQGLGVGLGLGCRLAAVRCVDNADGARGLEREAGRIGECYVAQRGALAATGQGLLGQRDVVVDLMLVETHIGIV